MLWKHYRKGEIKKEILSIKRFTLTLSHFGISNDLLSAKIADYYVTSSPARVNLFPYTHEILNYLQKEYHLHIITNGFEEVQHTKLRNGDLNKYFTKMITSEEAGIKKPAPGIFNYALSAAGATNQSSIMIGDDPDVDIKGACSVGMDAIWVNHNGIESEVNSTFAVSSLKEIEDIL